MLAVSRPAGRPTSAGSSRTSRYGRRSEHSSRHNQRNSLDQWTKPSRHRSRPTAVARVSDGGPSSLFQPRRRLRSGRQTTVFSRRSLSAAVRAVSVGSVVLFHSLSSLAHALLSPILSSHPLETRTRVSADESLSEGPSNRAVAVSRWDVHSRFGRISRNDSPTK